MKLYLVRHAQSALNAQRIHQSPSASLSEHGMRQAAILAKRFRTIPIDVILTSPFERARQTADLIGKELRKPIQTNKHLTEIKRPSEIEGRHENDPEVMHIKKNIEANAHDPNWRHSDEETFFDVKKRARIFLQQLDSLNEENVLVVTHGYFIKTLVCIMMFGDDAALLPCRAFAKTFAIENTSITVCGRAQGADWRVLQWNDDAHLGELA